MERIKDVLLTEEEIAVRIRELGKQITEDYEGKDIVAIGILKGSVLFMSDVVRRIDVPVEIDFMEVSSYGSGTTSSGVVRILKDLNVKIEGKHILIIEDIIDTGYTLSYLLENFKTRQPRSIKICTLLDKPDRRKADVSADYTGFVIPDEFVIGYGLDYDQRYRNLPYIGVLEVD